MTILCGTDFSSAAREAALTARAWATRARDTVELVHVLDLQGAKALAARGAGTALDALRAELERWKREATTLLDKEIAELGAGVTGRVMEGTADHELGARATEVRARSIVVAALGTRAGSAFTLGSTADRVAQRAGVPVLVVRASAPWTAWAERRATLRVLVSVDASPTSDAAVRAASALAALGDVELSAVHVYWPPAELEKHPGAGALPLGSGHRLIEQDLERQLSARLKQHAGGRDLPLKLLGGLGRTADHLARLAEEDGAHLIVVGTHQRGGLARFWHGSISHGVLDRARCSVLIAPEST